MDDKRASLFSKLQAALDTEETDEVRLLELAIDALKAKPKPKPRKQGHLTPTQLKTLKFLALGYPISRNRRSYIIETPNGLWKVMPNTLQTLQSRGLLDGLKITDRGRALAKTLRY